MRKRQLNPLKLNRREETRWSGEVADEWEPPPLSASLIKKKKKKNENNSASWFAYHLEIRLEEGPNPSQIKQQSNSNNKAATKLSIPFFNAAYLVLPE